MEWCEDGDVESSSSRHGREAVPDPEEGGIGREEGGWSWRLRLSLFGSFGFVSVEFLGL